jgi:hypothetical protein
MRLTRLSKEKMNARQLLLAPNVRSVADEWGRVFKNDD